MNINTLRTIILSDKEATVNTKDLSMQLLFNMYLHLHLHSSVTEPEITHEKIFLTNLITEGLVNTLDEDQDISTTLAILFPKQDFENDPARAGYHFNRFYRIEFDCFGNRTNNFETLISLKHRGYSDEELKRAISHYLLGYIESTRVSAKLLLAD